MTSAIRFAARTLCALGLAFILLGGAGPALAQAQVQALDAPCNDKGSNAEIKDCLRGLYKQADKELNRVWKLVMKKIAGADYPGPDERAAWRRELTLAQRAWITFRDRDCGAVLYEYWGGSGAGGFHSMCLLKHTHDRIIHLRERYDIPKGK